jgi:uncharacterized RDD family membrane protein YckC
MDPQNQGTRFETPSSGPAYPPQAYSQAQPATAGQPDLVKRLIASVIDFAVIGFVMGILNVVFAIALGRFGMMAVGLGGLAAVLLRDVAVQGRSLGKKLMGLNVVNAAGGPITPEQSIRRNSTLSLGMLGAAISPVPLVGWLIGAVLSLAAFGAAAYELYLVATGKPRFGDQLAGTHVVAEGQAAIAL